VQQADLGQFKYEAEIESHGQLAIEVGKFPSSVLLRLLQSGQIDVAAVPQSLLSRAVPALKAFDLPYVVNDRRHMQRIAEALRTFWGSIAQGSDLQLLGVLDSGFHVLAGRRPVSNRRDFRNLRIGTSVTADDPESHGVLALSPVSRFFYYLGANPISLVFSDLPTAYVDSDIDNVDTTLADIVVRRPGGDRLFVSLTNHSYSPLYIVSSRRLLSDRTRGVLGEAGLRAEQHSLTAGDRIDQDNVNTLQGRGLVVVSLGQDERELLKQVAVGIYDRFALDNDIRDLLVMMLKSAGN
jgi:TRAP-type C4-dicarboxylate transport system substrate-binding protein